MAPTQSGTDRVYAKWPASSANATDAHDTVTYEGGSTTVTVNQKQNGGQWNLLGTCPFDPVAGRSGDADGGLRRHGNGRRDPGHHWPFNQWSQLSSKGADNRRERHQIDFIGFVIVHRIVRGAMIARLSWVHVFGEFCNTTWSCVAPASGWEASA